MKPYPKYKDSGVEWIGEVPEGWGVERLKRIAKIVNGSTPKTSIAEYWNGDIVWVTPADISKVSSLKISGSEKKITHEGLNNCGTSIVPQGSIILTTRAPIGNLAIANNSLCTNQGCKSLIPTNIYSPYLFYFLFVSKEILQSIGSGTTFKELSTDNLASFMIVLPPKYEQKSIAAYLDRKTTQIDNLISKKQKLIELLKEERAAIINQAVTKGLNPDAPMKDSGIEWIGEVPEHWEMEKVSHAFSTVGSGTTPIAGNPEYHNEGITPWINTGDLNNGRLKTCSKKITNIAFNDYSALKIYPIGSLIIAMYGATIGKVSILDFTACTNQACCVLSESKKWNVKYVFYWFIANKEHIVSMSYGGGQPNISQEIIKSLRIPLPERNEQYAIITYLDHKTTKIDQTTSKIERQINLLKEYRTALISEVVTGKIDVRT